MLRNHIKIAWRSILKNKGIFSINVLGLSLGIASCLLIMLFVADELSFDRFNKKADAIVRVVFKAKINDEEIKEAVVMAPVAQVVKEDFPEVLDATRIRQVGIVKIIQEKTIYRNIRFAYVDPNFFNVFTLPLRNGNAISPLSRPNTVVISEREAVRIFGNATLAIGKMITVQGQDQSYEITAVMENIPINSHFHFDMIASMEGYAAAKSTSWTNSNFFTYLVIKEGYSYKELESKFPPLIKIYMGPQIRDELGIGYDEFAKENQLGLFLQPLTDIHLKSDFSATSELEQGGNIQNIYIFSAVALFMLLIACINFMNLSTAAASRRGKEVGIKKVLGSGKKQLIYQFLTESLIATILAMGVALLLLIIFLPLFNTLSGKALELSYLAKPSILVCLFVLTILVSILAGGYPAFYISSFRPIMVLKGVFRGTGKSNSIRNGLVVFQFVISVVLIFATITVYQQMSFIQNKELGYDKEQTLVIRDTNVLGNDEDAFKKEVSQDSRITGITHSSFVPVGPTDNDMSGTFLNHEFLRRMFVYNIDDKYIPTMGMEMIAGRNFSENPKMNTNQVILNERAVKSLSFGDNPIGKEFFRDTNEGGQAVTVIGVVKDFHFRPLHLAIEPLIMFNNPYGGLIIKTKVSEMPELIAGIEHTWKKFETSEPLYYVLLDEAYRQTYLAEQKMGAILGIFALLIIFVACLGLFGLVTFTAEQRFKEIGIRKVLGSTVTQIVAMLSADFLKLVGISFLIAFPFGFYIMNRWLEDFAYRTEMQWWMFVLTGTITIGIAFITIGWKSFKAAIQNPVKSLRTE